MKTLTKNLILIVLFSLSICQYIHAQDIEPPKRDLEFVISEENEVLDPSIKYHIGDTLPSHVAILKLTTNGPGIIEPDIRINFNNVININQINRDLYRDPFSSGRGGFSIYHCSIKGDDSSKMLEFMFFSQNGPNSNRGSRLSSSGNNQTYYILANSEQQARQFTEALIKGYDIDTYNNLKRLKDELETYQEIVRNGATVISKMEAEYKELEDQKNKLYKEYAKVNYLSDENLPDIKKSVQNELRGTSGGEENIPGIDNIVKVKEELAQALREVDFELIGLDAKIESINKYKLKSKIIDDETLIKLNQILMATDIERAGVLARKQAFENSFKQTTQLYNLILNSKKALVDLEKYKNKFNAAPQVVSQRETELKNPHDMYKYIEIGDNKVVIKPVKQD